MLTQVKNVRFWMQAKLGQRGAEMVEYAIVLACIAAVGMVVYSTGTGGEGQASSTLYGVLDNLWTKISNTINPSNT